MRAALRPLVRMAEDLVEADIAAIPFEWPDGAENGTVSSATSCRPENMVNHLIGVGDDVFAMGLFLDHQNRYDELRAPRNRPIMRSGMIAAMPDDLSPGQHILVELRSTGGLSGSPLWVWRVASRFTTPRRA